MIIQRFNLNLIPNQSPVIVHVNQYDTGTGRLIATLYEGNEPYSPNGTAVIQGTKPDGHGFQYTATLDGNVVTADLTEQMSPVAGDVRAQIVVTESSGVTGTFVFIMRVQPSALPSDTDMSESDYQYIEEAIREAQEAVQTAQEATETAQEAVERAQEAIAETQENAEDSEAWAQGTRGGIPVGPTDPTYEHNAEYWAQYAERYAQGGLHYKASIPFVDIPTTGMREGDMYDITDDFTTDSRFTEGAGIKVKGGTNIAWNSDNKWDILALPYIPKTTFNGRSGSILPMAGDYDSRKILLSSILHIGGETQDNVQEALEALENNKADKVDNAVEDNFAGLDADGNLKDSGKKASDFATPSDISGQQSLLKDTVGFTGKNRLKNTATTQTINGVTFTVNSDGSVTANGTASANASVTIATYLTLPTDIIGQNVILTGCPEGGSTNGKYFMNAIGFRSASSGDTDTGNGVQINNVYDFTANTATKIYIEVRAGYNAQNLTFYPMIRKADITDPTYEPYHESVQNQLNAQGVLGAKNLWKYPYDITAQTLNGMTLTADSDGVVTLNGTTTSLSEFLLLGTTSTMLKVADMPSKNLILKGSGSADYCNEVIYRDSNNTYISDQRAFNDNMELVIPSNAYYMRMAVLVKPNVTLANAVLYPMLRLASDPDDTYQPYAMTNRELTEVVTGKSSPKILATASANQTYSSQLSILYAEYQKYSNSQKRKMFIGENGYSDIIYNIVSINGTTFSTGHHIDPQGIINDECIRLSTNKIYRLRYNDGVITQTDMSSNTHPSSLVLYIG